MNTSSWTPPIHCLFYHNWEWPRKCWLIGQSGLARCTSKQTEQITFYLWTCAHLPPGTDLWILPIEEDGEKNKNEIHVFSTQWIDKKNVFQCLKSALLYEAFIPFWVNVSSLETNDNKHWARLHGRSVLYQIHLPRSTDIASVPSAYVNGAPLIIRQTLRCHPSQQVLTEARWMQCHSGATVFDSIVSRTKLILLVRTGGYWGPSLPLMVCQR